jgi:protein-disulfide isomerase
MSKQFLGIIVVVILAFVGFFVLSGNKGTSNSGKQSSSGTLTQHIEGQGKAGVTLVEYGDYECPFCGEYFPTVKQVQSDLNQQIYFQFRNFPLISIHQNAFAGARAAEAAALQNKFWQMHDLLYEDQTQWSGASDPTPYFNQYATQLGLNLTQFKSDYASSKVNDLINADMAEGNKLNISGTPTFYLDGKLLDSSQLVDSSSQPSVAAFEKVINAEIAKKAVQAKTAKPQ